MAILKAYGARPAAPLPAHGLSLAAVLAVFAPFAMPAAVPVVAALTVPAAALVVAASLSGAGAQAQQSYGIRPGDRLRVEVLEDPTLNRTVLVAPDGRISFPQAGTLNALGRNVESIQGDLTDRLASSFAAPPNVFVSIEGLAVRENPGPAGPAVLPVITVYVVGEANKTGRIEVAPGTTVLQMFGVIGGFSKFAAIKRIQLRRTDPASRAETVYSLNYRAIERGQGGSGAATLLDGDVIVVPQRHLFE